MSTQMNSRYPRSLSVLKFILNFLMPLAGFLWLALSMRLLSALLIWVPLLLHRHLIERQKVILLICLWALYFASSVAPFDISFINYPGPPRFVRLITGLPSAEGQVLLLNHEAMWGGCLIHRNEPKWVWVW
jgi:hypothetical protein